MDRLRFMCTHWRCRSPKKLNPIGMRLKRRRNHKADVNKLSICSHTHTHTQILAHASSWALNGMFFFSPCMPFFLSLSALHSFAARMPCVFCPYACFHVPDLCKFPYTHSLSQHSTNFLCIANARILFFQFHWTIEDDDCYKILMPVWTVLPVSHILENYCLLLFTFDKFLYWHIRRMCYGSNRCRL